MTIDNGAPLQIALHHTEIRSISVVGCMVGGAYIEMNEHGKLGINDCWFTIQYRWINWAFHRLF